jgi:rhamnosyltransferase
LIIASVIILTKNAGENFERLLRKILAQKLVGEFEIIVIDSGSTDNTLHTCEELGINVHKIEPSHFHHGKTRNLGARLARGDFLVFVTQDALPQKDNWLQTLVDDFRDNNVMAVYGRQLPWSNASPQEKFFYKHYFPERKLVVTLIDNHIVGSESNIFVSNANSAIRKEIWENYNFSEKIPMAEDKEFASNVLCAGYQILYDPEACVYHSHIFNLSHLFRRYFDYGRSLNLGVHRLPNPQKSSLGRMFGYLLSELVYFIYNRNYQSIFAFPMYEMTKLIGLFLGTRSKNIPTCVVSHFSEVK